MLLITYILLLYTILISVYLLCVFCSSSSLIIYESNECHGVVSTEHDWWYWWKRTPINERSHPSVVRFSDICSELLAAICQSTDNSIVYKRIWYPYIIQYHDLSLLSVVIEKSYIRFKNCHFALQIVSFFLLVSSISSWYHCYLADPITYSLIPLTN